MRVALPFVTLWINELLALALFNRIPPNILREDKMTEGSRYGVNRSPLVYVEGHLAVAWLKCKSRMVARLFIKL